MGDRARKIDKGILITRFELPFNIWWYVTRQVLRIAAKIRRLTLCITPVGHAIITLEWAFAIMRRRRKSGITTRLRYIRSDANATFAVAGLRSRRIQKYASYTHSRGSILAFGLNISLVQSRILPMSSYLVPESKNKIGTRKKTVDSRYMVRLLFLSILSSCTPLSHLIFRL